jgi:glycosyltransferase involved in cell wall biosynthesis
MKQQKAMTVLMLDDEPLMTDRRIILEGQTLVQHGYKVILATKGDGVKSKLAFERGISIHRFVDAAAYDSTQIHSWKHYPENNGVRARVNRELPFLPLWMRSWICAVIWPPIMAASVRRNKLIKKILGKWLEPTVYLLMIRPRFLLPYIKRAFHQSTIPSNYTWQESVKKFALELNPNVVHCHDLPNLSLGKDVANQLGIPLIYDAHEIYTMQYFTDESRRIELCNLERSLIPYVDVLITVNSQCVNVLETTYSIQDVIALSNATEIPSEFNPEVRQRLWHQRFKLSSEVKILVFQGGINPVRNIDELIHALSELPDYFHIGFITYAKDIAYYQNLSKQLGVFNRIHYVLEIPWDEVVSWLASADVGIMPYQATNYNAEISSPNKLYEFVVAGIPIIGSTELVNVKQAIENDGLGLVTLLRDAASYRKIILAMFDDPERLEGFSKNVSAVRDKYSWAHEEPKLIRTYQRILGRDYVPKSTIKYKKVETICAA